jgi:hypothetical protein
MPCSPSLCEIRKPRSLNPWIREASGPGERGERCSHAGARQHRLARRVKRNQLERQPGGEDPMRGLGVD